jgi:hypothetical protein
MGDSAFVNTWFLVSAFKKPRGSTLPCECKLFNDALKNPRVISEHTIGILKGRFLWLQGIWHLITDDPNDMKENSKLHYGTLHFAQSTSKLPHS